MIIVTGESMILGKMPLKMRSGSNIADDTGPATATPGSSGGSPHIQGATLKRSSATAKMRMQSNASAKRNGRRIVRTLILENDKDQKSIRVYIALRCASLRIARISFPIAASQQATYEALPKGRPAP